jgi:hypothetical protein
LSIGFKVGYTNNLNMVSELGYPLQPVSFKSYLSNHSHSLLSNVKAIQHSLHGKDLTDHAIGGALPKPISTKGSDTLHRPWPTLDIFL